MAPGPGKVERENEAPKRNPRDPAIGARAGKTSQAGSEDSRARTG